jgi:thiol-disulfide isomerase/thioredoxin
MLKLIVSLSLSLNLLWATSLQANERYLAFESEEITVELYTNDEASWRFIWLYSQYDELMHWEQDFVRDMQQKGLEVWATDILGSLFLTRGSNTVRALSGDSVATVIEAAEAASAQDGKGIILLGSERMTGLALKGIHAWQNQHPNKTTHLKGAILLFPNLYANTPVAGEAPIWDPIVQASQIPVMILQPEQGVSRWYAGMLATELNQQYNATYTWVLPEVKDYFLAPWTEERTAAETQAIELLPQLFLQAAHQLARHAPATHPAQTIALVEPSESSDAPLHHALPRLHEFSEPKAMPSLKGITFDGKAMNLADWHGKVVLVNFWATWCPPCVTEIPSMNRLQAKYQAQGLEIFSVDFQESAEDIAEFAKQVPIDFPVLLDLDGRISKDWGVFSFPTTFVVDRQGRVRYSLNQGVEWDIPELEAPLVELLNEALVR